MESQNFPLMCSGIKKISLDTIIPYTIPDIEFKVLSTGQTSANIELTPGQEFILHKAPGKRNFVENRHPQTTLNLSIRSIDPDSAYWLSITGRQYW